MLINDRYVGLEINVFHLMNHEWCKNTRCQFGLWFLHNLNIFHFIQQTRSNHCRKCFFAKVTCRTAMKWFTCQNWHYFAHLNMCILLETYSLQRFWKISLYRSLNISKMFLISFLLSWSVKTGFGHNIVLWWYFTNAEVLPLKAIRVQIVVRKIVLFIAGSLK